MDKFNHLWASLHHLWCKQLLLKRERARYSKARYRPRHPQEKDASLALQTVPHQIGLSTPKSLIFYEAAYYSFKVRLSKVKRTWTNTNFHGELESAKDVSFTSAKTSSISLPRQWVTFSIKDVIVWLMTSRDKTLVCRACIISGSWRKRFEIAFASDKKLIIK